MEDSPDVQCVWFVSGANSFALRSLSDGEVVAEVPLGHTLVNGASQGNMIATIGLDPNSLIIINDWHAPEQQQLVALSCQPLAVAISPTQDRIAVVLDNGLTHD